MALLAAAALAPPAGQAQTAQVSAKPRGALTQLKGSHGCVTHRTKKATSCAEARALQEPGPFMGSRAIGISPDGRHVYVASSASNAIAVFARDKRTGRLSQPSGRNGCIAAGGAQGCAVVVGLARPNSVAISPDGRNVYASARDSGSIVAFARNPKTGGLRQLLSGGCISGLALPGCLGGVALEGPDVLVVSPDGANVYVGSFFGNAVAVLDRDASSGGLSQPASPAACIAEANANCSVGIALGAPEGLAISSDGTSVYVGSSLSNAVAILDRDPGTGDLSQAGDGTGCIVQAALAGCTTGVQLGGANAVALAPGDGQAYVTSLLSNSVTSFDRSASTGDLTQKSGTPGCLVYLEAVGCSFGRAMKAPEGIVVAPGGRNVYAAAFSTGAIDVLNRSTETGRVSQKPGRPGCLARKLPGCARARALKGVSSLAVSADGRFVYSTAATSNAVGVFRRTK